MTPLAKCNDCGVTPPRWMGGVHECVRKGQVYWFGMPSRHVWVNDRELEFLRWKAPKRA